MAQFLSPGVEVTLQDFSVYTASVSNTIVGVVGGFTKGPFNEPTLVTSRNDLIRKFGNPSELDHAGIASMMFLARGNQLYVVRVEDGTATPASVSFSGTVGNTIISEVIKFTMLEKGTYGNGYTAQVSNVDGLEFKLTIYQGTKQVDQYDLSLDPDSNIYVGKVNFDLVYAEYSEGAGVGSQKAAISFGSGANGTINIEADLPGAAGNENKVVVIKPDTPGEDLEVTYNQTSKLISISLATDGAESKDAEARIGSGENSTVLLRAITENKEDGNDLSVEVVIPSEAGQAPKAELMDAENTYLKVYLGTATPGVSANAVLHDGEANGEITLTVDDAGVAGNSYTVEVVEGSGNDVNLSTTLAGTALTITLGTDSGGALDATKNTATLISQAINTTVTGISSSVSGDGTYVYAAVVASTQFTGGVDEITAASKNTATIINDILEDVPNRQYVCNYSGDGTESLSQAEARKYFEGGVTGHYAKAFNTAKSIVNEINAIPQKTFTAAYSGDGTGEIDTAMAETPFTGGVDGGGIDALVEATTQFSGGTDGLPLSIEAVVEGLEFFSNPDALDINILICPGRWEAPIVNQMSSLCQTRGDAMFLVDPPQGLRVSDVIKYRNGTLTGENMLVAPLDTFFGAMYYPWVQVINPVTGQYVWTPPSGVVAGAIAYSDNRTELWMAPAGLTRGVLPDVVAAERELSKDDMDNLYSNGNTINPILNYKRQGFVIWGNRTLQKATTALDRVNVARLVLYLMKVVAISTAYLVFEQNDDTTWNQWIGMIRPILERTKKARGIDEYIIVMDETTVTVENIENGEMPGYIAIRPVKAAEFIPIDFVLTAQGATLEVGTV